MSKRFNGDIFSKNFYKLRKGNMSQKELAGRLGVDTNTIRRWEKGKHIPSPDHLVNIADIFNISVEELVHWEIKSEKDIIRIPLENRGIYDSYQVTLEIGDVKDSGGIILPYVTPNNFTTNEYFKSAYDMDVEIQITGDAENLMEMIYLYDDALDEGIIEAATNILRVIVRAIMNGKILNPNKKAPLQDKLNYYIKALEMINHPAGRYYRAFSLIYTVMETDKTEDDNFTDGLLLMDELALEGNGLAIKYLEHIYSASDDENELNY